jgi:hypothetical protein
MDDLERELFLAAQRRQKLAALGFPDWQCLFCPENSVECVQFDHVAGQKHDDQVWPICKNCHAKRTLLQRMEPSSGENPRNVFEVIGRWLLGIVEYFEMLIPNLRRFGEFLLHLAKSGYGDGLTIDYA